MLTEHRRNRYWVLNENNMAVPCTEDYWRAWRRDANNFRLMDTSLDHGIRIVTSFIGYQSQDSDKPLMFRLQAFTDCGIITWFSDYFYEAHMMHLASIRDVQAIINIAESMYPRTEEDNPLDRRA